MPAAITPSSGLIDTWGRRNRKLEDRQCAQCGAVFRPLRASSAYCSRPCARKKNGGHNRKPECWWVCQKGYIVGRIREFGRVRYVKMHRLVMERALGRALLPHEDVHHLDGDKQNNSLENLQLLTHAEHSRITNSERVYRRGYKLNLSDAERAARADRMRKNRAAIAKATGETA